ncbi:hypothetical protein V9T40_001558 [Parthenolecanium corni]|uniref:Uncharacterized protein n=1 Tax=Parthenolecanium corni TaxID=536013 RepID=A0AAN9Y6P3_9HEMI
MTECEAVLLGREQVHGSANGTALAALCKSLMRKTDLHRKYILRCHRENGLQMIPYRRLEDEGFESDEDLTSLGSCDDNSAIYVSDHALHVVKSRSSTAGGTTSTTIINPRPSSQSSSTDVTSGSVSSVGTDSANSSGASDNDETDNSLSHNVNHSTSNHSISPTKPSNFDKKPKADDVECFAYHEIAFCHTDPSLPKVIVWVIKTKRQSKSASNEYSYGLEAVVFMCHSEQKFRALYKSFQEFSRRQKLEKPVRSRWKEEFKGSTTIARAPAAKPAGVVIEKAVTKGEATNNAVMYNLVQRVDTDGVTHIEVTRPVVDGATPTARVVSEHTSEPSSIISINTPDSGNVLKATAPKKSEKLIESVIRAEEPEALVGPPPERPERKKNAKSVLDKEKMAVVYAAPNREKVVKGQYVRVSVDQKTLSSPMSRATSGWLFGEVKPAAVLSYPSRLAWSRAEAENYHIQQQQKSQEVASTMRRSRKMEKDHRERHRSKSSVILRRPESPKRYPMPHRYVDAIQINNSLPNRFFGRLRELTTGHHASNAHKFKRRNSIGDLTNANGIHYQQPPDSKKFDKNHSLTKSTPNLKSMIKNKNGKFCKDGYNENEPKKVTFSAYATVQVVD